MSKPNPNGHINPLAAQTLYRFWSNETLLYVGISQSFLSRMDQHHAVKEWWPLVTNITLQHYPNRKLVEAAEKTAIQTEHPLHNLVHQPDWEQYSQHIKSIATGNVFFSKKFGNGKHEWIMPFLQAITPSPATLPATITDNITAMKYVQAWWVMSAYELAREAGYSCRACESMRITQAAIRMSKHGAAIIRKLEN